MPDRRADTDATARFDRRPAPEEARELVRATRATPGAATEEGAR